MEPTPRRVTRAEHFQDAFVKENEAMPTTLRGLITGTLISALVCATGLAAPKHHSTTAGRTDATKTTQKHTKAAAKHHKNKSSAKKNTAKKHAGKKTHNAKKAAHKKNNKTAKTHSGKKHHTVNKAGKVKKTTKHQ
jgi:hypothetical protein